MLELKITIKGKTTGDLEIALTEIADKVENGYTSGFDSNGDGSFNFEIEGEEE